MKKNKCRDVLLLCILLVTVFSSSPAQTGSPDEIIITLPYSVIITVIKAALPLRLDKGPYLKGKVWIQTIDQLKIGSNKVEFEMTIQGENLKLETHFGKQVLSLDIGSLNAVFSCDTSLRYDASKRLLYITPKIMPKPNKNPADQFSARLLEMLSLANGMEYPVEIQKIQPIVTKIGGDIFHMDMDITHISTEAGSVFIRGLPTVIKETELERKANELDH